MFGLNTSRLIIFTALGLGAAGCRSVQNNSGLRSQDFGEDHDDLPQLTCASGTGFFVSLAAITPLPAIKDLNIGIDAPQSKVVMPTDNNNLRLGVCVGPTQAVLKNIVLFAPNTYTVVDVTSNAKIQGLKEAVSTKAYAGLSIEVPFENTVFFGGDARPTRDVLLIKGDAKGTGAGFVTVNTDAAGKRSIASGTEIAFGRFVRERAN